ncbi:MAG: hypothetical protein C0433_11400 [Cyclobacterium sp.]|nr:hypothetical protein [Cyclobacterium sp.]
MQACGTIAGNQNNFCLVINKLLLILNDAKKDGGLYFSEIPLLKKTDSQSRFSPFYQIRPHNRPPISPLMRIMV